jgi:hypothetical protein
LTAYTPIYNLPYVEASDLVANYPTVSEELAENIETAIGGASKILQVQSVFKADVFTTSSTSLTDVTGLSVSITPSSASNTILVVASLALSNGTAGFTSRGAILRGSTVIGGGTAAGSRPSITFWFRQSTSAGNNIATQSFSFIDSPASTSAQTYKIQIAAESGSTAAIGRSYADDTDAAAGGRIGASLIVMEVKA